MVRQRFDAPSLGLSDVPIGAIVTSALHRYAGRSTLNRELWVQALNTSDPEAEVMLWQHVIEAGDISGHYGLGLTLFTLDRFADAFHHLR